MPLAQRSNQGITEYIQVHDVSPSHTGTLDISSNHAPSHMAQISPGIAQKLQANEPNSEVSNLIDSWDRATRLQRLSIVDALMNSRKAAVPALRQCLSQGSDAQQILACRLLAEMRASEATGDIASLVKKDEVVSLYAINALRDIGDPSGAKPLRELLAASSNLSTGKAICTLIALGRLGTKHDIDEVQSFLENGNDEIATASAVSLAMLGCEDGEHLLLGMTTNNAPSVQNMAIKGLGYLDTQESVETLTSIINEHQRYWKSEARIALARLAVSKLCAEEKLVLLAAYGKSPNPQIADWALAELADMNTPESVEALERMSEDSSKCAKKAQRLIMLRGLDKNS